MHNVVGTPVDANVPGLVESARKTMHGHPVYLEQDQADLLLAQFQETCRYRCWILKAVAIMANHVHVVVGVADDPDPADLLRDLKSYSSRALNRHASIPRNGRWWTQSGSRRILRGENAVLGAVKYVQNQQRPLLLWIVPGALD